jgi:hypothetical protein
MTFPSYQYVPALPGNDWRMVFDSQVPRVGLLNKRGISLTFLNSCAMVHTERPNKANVSSLFHGAFLLATLTAANLPTVADIR